MNLSEKGYERTHQICACWTGEDLKEISSSAKLALKQLVLFVNILNMNVQPMIGLFPKSISKSFIKKSLLLCLRHAKALTEEKELNCALTHSWFADAKAPLLCFRLACLLATVGQLLDSLSGKGILP